MNSDFKELLEIFGEAKVKYLIIGGYAVANRACTKDIISSKPPSANK